MVGKEFHTPVELALRVSGLLNLVESFRWISYLKVEWNCLLEEK